MNNRLIVKKLNTINLKIDGYIRLSIMADRLLTNNQLLKTVEHNGKQLCIFLKIYEIYLCEMGNTENHFHVILCFKGCSLFQGFCKFKSCFISINFKWRSMFFELLQMPRDWCWVLLFLEFKYCCILSRKLQGWCSTFMLCQQIKFIVSWL